MIQLRVYSLQFSCLVLYDKFTGTSAEVPSMLF